MHKVGSDYIDVDYSQDINISAGNFTPDFPNDLTLWDGYKDAIFAIESNVNNWETVFKKLSFTEAEKYGINVYDLDTATAYGVGRDGSFIDFNGSPIAATHWTSGGLNIPTLSNFLIIGTGAIAPMSNSSGTHKITHTLDYSASAVTDFELKPTAKVFFISDLGITQGHAEDSGPINIENVPSPRGPYLRSALLDLTDSHWIYPMLTPFDHSVADSATQTALRNYMLSFPGTLEVHGLFAGSSTPGTPSDFPLYSGGNTFIDVGLASTGIISYIAGGFCGLIKQDGQSYYFWQNDTGATTGPGAVNYTI